VKILIKNALRKALPLLIFLITFGLICYGVFYFLIVPKTPATVQEIAEVLVKNGYEPQDITALYVAQNPNVAQNLKQCIAIEKEDIHFEFYSFNNEKSAINLYSSAYSLIIQMRRGFPNVETNTMIANYCKYTLEASGTYSVAMYVGTTAVYAYSDTKNMDKIKNILKEINY